MKASFEELRNVLAASLKLGATKVSIKKETNLSSQKVDYYLFEAVNVGFMTEDKERGTYFSTSEGAKFVRDYGNGFKDLSYIV